MRVIAWYVPCKKIKKIMKILPLLQRLTFAAMPLGGFVGDFYGVFDSMGHVIFDFSEPTTYYDLDYESRPLISRYQEFVVGPENSLGTVCGKAVIVLSAARVIQGALFPWSVF